MEDRTLNPDRRNMLFESIRDGRCVLFLGPQAAIGPSGKRLDAELCEQVPARLRALAGPGSSLAHLCQLAEHDIAVARAAVVRHLKTLKTGKAAGPTHRHLAELPFSLIIEATPDPFMENALEAARCPQSAFYNFRAAAPAELADVGTIDSPLIYGMLGSADAPPSIPLSAEEEVCHLVALVREQPGLPKSLTAILRDNGNVQRSALFIGFDFGAWQTRMLLHGLFATAPATVITPVPAVATAPVPPRLPSGEDLEFLWARYRIIFATAPPEQFAADLLAAWKLQPAAVAGAAPREVNRRSLLNFLAKVPSDEFANLTFVFGAFDREYGASLQTKGASEQARIFVRWLDENKRVPELIEALRTAVPELFMAHEASLY